MGEKLLTAREAAEYLGETEAWVRRLVWRAQKDLVEDTEHPIPYTKIGGSIRFIAANLDEWVEANTVKGRAAS